MTRGWTIGVELELSDARRDTPLPQGATWDRSDYTIVNSNGVANDPTGEVWPFGGEINTAPAETVEQQAEMIRDVLRSLDPLPSVNYRSNFHVHIHAPGLADDVSLVKRLASYVGRFGQEAFGLVDPLPPRPTGDDQASQGARRRWSRRRVSHHASLSSDRLAAISSAASVEEVRRLHAPLSRDGRPQYHLAPRCGVNLRSLWESPGRTVEFRHFSMSLDLDELSSAMRWCVLFLSSALGRQEAPSQLLWPGARFPRQPLYDHWLETRYRATSRCYHSADEIRKTLRQWEEEGTLYERAGVVHRESVEESVVGSLFAGD